MRDIVIFAEESSGGIVAENLAQSLGLGERTQCLLHEGRSDLERSFPNKIRAWREQTPVRFIVMRDNDGGDCLKKKSSLLHLVPKVKLKQVKIRLVMQQLESWYLGDPQALSDAGLIKVSLVANWSKGKKYRNPDAISAAKQEFRRKVGERGQIELARLIGPRLNPDRNCSRSFHAFVGALRWAGR